MQYDPAIIEPRWQQYWAQHRTFHAPNPGEEGFDPGRPKFYVLDMFPYPSGVGLHVGHPLGYIATDIVARYRRMQGYNVLHPMGYDAFGLPAEQFAVTHGVHPRITTEGNIANMSRQLRELGLSYDWERELATTDPAYYRWTQWIFLQLYQSWFDPAASRARPIADLEQMLEAGQLYVTAFGELEATPTEGLDPIGGLPIGVRRWQELSPEDRREILDDHRLAYLAEVPVNWCPALGTVLANEEVTNEGRSERGNHPVFRRPLKQWMLRITAYAERLLADLERVDWPEKIRLMQRHWIGRSEGALVNFIVEKTGDALQVFTTRPDTLFGATYMVLAPEHPLVEGITTPEQREEVTGYQRQAQQRSEMDRQSEAKVKTGVFTGAYAINPVNDQRIPIWIADYVLTGYGTGAIMAVPAHDERDFAFAKTFGLPVRAVVMPSDDWLREQMQRLPEEPGGDMVCHEVSMDQIRQRYLQAPASFPEAFTGTGEGVNSENPEISLNDLETDHAKRHITLWLEEKGLGQAKVQYKLRDWLFSRQRYWGEPFPILHAPDGSIVAVDESELPVELPPMEDFQPHASEDPNAPVQTPLSRAPDAWKYVERDGVRYTRELNTMPQWAGSCWYYLRFLDPHNSERFVGEDAERYWMVSRRKNGEPHTGGVDLYVGGAEHAVLHLLYARFWHKVLYDLGHVSTPEPFGRLFNQGYIQAFAYTDARGVYMPAAEVQERPDQAVTLTRREMVRGEMREVQHTTACFHLHPQTGQATPVVQEFGKMGKSLANAVTPDEVRAQYGCDTLRVYEMYLGPLDQSKLWRTQDIAGPYRFLQRVWRNFVAEDGGLKVSEEPAEDALRRRLHRTIAKVTADFDRLSFNTAIAALIELNNELVPQPTVPREVAEPMVLMLAPIAPHLAEELWQRLGHQASLAYEPWPRFDPTLLVEDQVEYPVQINGKLRGKVTVPAGADQAQVEAAALADERVREALGGKEVRKVIVVKDRMINLVAK